MPLVGIALIYYPLFCLCGQHHERRKAEPLAERLTRCEVSLCSRFALWRVGLSSVPRLRRLIRYENDPHFDDTRY